MGENKPNFGIFVILDVKSSLAWIRHLKGYKCVSS